MTVKKPPVLSDIPIKEFSTLAEKGTQHVVLRIVRVIGGKKYSITSNRQTSVTDLVSGAFSNWLESVAGGGEYVVYVSDVSTGVARIVPDFQLNFLGAPKDPRAAVPAGVPIAQAGSPMAQALLGQQQQGHGGLPATGAPSFQTIHGIQVPMSAFQTPNIQTPMLTPGGLSAPPQDQLPSWAKAHPHAMQWPVYFDSMQRQGHLPAGASMHSDAMAHGYAQTLDTRNQHKDAELAMLRERHEQERRNHEQQMQLVKDQMNALHVKAEAEKSDAKIDAIRSELVALRSAPAEKASFDWSGFAALALPVLPAVLQAMSARSTAQEQTQLEHMKLNQASSTALVTAVTAKDKGGADWVKLTPLLLPLAAEMFKSFGPGAKAEAQAAGDETKMMLFKMLADMQIEKARAEGEVPTWLPLVSSLVEAMPDVVAGFNAGKNGQGPPQLPGPGGMQAPSPAGTQGEVIEDDDAVWAGFAQHNPEAAHETRMVLQQVPPETQFHTHEWRAILFNLHDKLDPPDMIELLADHLTHCAKFMMLPPPFAEVFTDPEKAFTTVLQILPIWKRDPAYGQIIIDGCTQRILELIAEEAAEKAEEEQDQTEAEFGAAASPEGVVIDAEPVPATPEPESSEETPDDADEELTPAPYATQPAG